MSSVVLDSGVLLALWDPVDQRHRAARVAVETYLAEGSRPIVPVSVLSEATGRSVPSDAVRGAAYRRRARLSLAEALVAATGETAGAQEILTVNSRLGEVNGRVWVLDG